MTMWARGGALWALAFGLFLSGCAGLGGFDNGGGGGGGDTLTGLTAAALADAATSGHTRGANLVRWPLLGTHIAAYLIYRDDNPFAPVGIADRATGYFIDSASLLPGGAVMESMELSFSIDPGRAYILDWNTVPTYESSTANRFSPDMTLGDQDFTISARRVPVKPGDLARYRVRTVYITPDPGGLNDPLQFPDEYQLRLGELSGATPVVTVIQPPILTLPADGIVPTDGNYQCMQSFGATDYTLQLSPGDGAFNPATTYVYSASIFGTSFAGTTVSLASLYSRPGFYSGVNVFWRMGARAAGQNPPRAWRDANQHGWVYSTRAQYILPAGPPPAP
ncbi:MAG: hypothetical protein ACYC7E_22170 [Armatimonadota bacterium]